METPLDAAPMEIAATQIRVAREQARQRRRTAQRKQQRHAERQAACDRELDAWIASTSGLSAASELDRPTWMALFVRARRNANELERKMRAGHLDVGRSPPSPGPPPPSPSPPSPSPPPLFLEMVDDEAPSPPSPSPPSPSPPPSLLQMVDDVWPPILSRLGEHGLSAVACTCSYLRNHEAVARERANVWAMYEAINVFLGTLAASTAETRYQAPPPTAHPHPTTHL